MIWPKKILIIFYNYLQQKKDNLHTLLIFFIESFTFYGKMKIEKCFIMNINTLNDLEKMLSDEKISYYLECKKNIHND